MQNKKFNHFFFDLDGTLTESGPGITNCVKYALEKFGIQENNLENLKRFIGPPLLESFQKFYGFSAKDAEKAVVYYRERFGPTGIFENSLYPEIRETLEKLRAAGKKLYLATSKPEIYVPRIMNHFDLMKYFDFTAGSDSQGTRSQKSQVIDFVIRENKLEEAVNNGNVVMIGDRLHDIEGARKNNIPCIAVLWGYGSREEFHHHQAAFIIEKPSDLLNF